ncbi:MAG: (2Fe-2S)-binding protein [Acidobacteria bacterium]|nr:(2Fe-2S)-binding protein [Acidobacteriota bacterium]MBV9624404.1 (2Fe-2S)-binding protein [Acidobacteriota bacterium]
MKTSAQKREFSLNVNGVPRNIRAYPAERLLDVLRYLGLTGTKEGCGEGECGACSVLVDGRLVVSCLMPVAQAEGAKLLTIEGVTGNQRFRSLQETFAEGGGAQCGICTPGMILAGGHLLERNPAPTIEEIREALSGNLCRCTGYLQIFEAVAEAARRCAGT